MDTTEERVSELKDRAIEMINDEQQQQKTLKNEQCIIRVDKMIKHTYNRNIRRRERKWGRKYI